MVTPAKSPEHAQLDKLHEFLLDFLKLLGPVEKADARHVFLDALAKAGGANTWLEIEPA